MSGPLRIGLSGERLEALRVDVVVVSCPSDERPLRALASRADWRCCGAISQLLRDGSFRGETGEAALLGGGVGLAASQLLVLGRGEEGALHPERLQAWGFEALSRCLELSARSVALALLPAAEQSLRDQSAALVAAAVQVWRAAAKTPAAGLDVWLLASESERVAAVAALHELAPRLPAGVELQDSRSAPAEGVFTAQRHSPLPGPARQAPSAPYR